MGFSPLLTINTIFSYLFSEHKSTFIKPQLGSILDLQKGDEIHVHVKTITCFIMKSMFRLSFSMILGWQNFNEKLKFYSHLILLSIICVMCHLLMYLLVSY